MRYLSLILALTILALQSCNLMGERIKGNGNVISQTRQVDKISRIKLMGGMDVILEKGEPSVKVEADENLIPYILTESEDGELKIRYRENVNLKSSNTIKVYVTTPSFQAIKVAGSGDVTMNSNFSNDDEIELAIAGSGDIEGNINTPNVNAKIEGSGNMTLRGETKDVKVKILGSGNYKGEALKAENVDVSIAGSGDAYVFADARLNVKTRGSGDVKYKGNATVSTSVAGSGSVVKD